MALGGGTFTVQNKVLPGAYINFVSASAASNVFGDRGVAAMALPLDWGPDNTVFEVSGEDFLKNCRALFGCGQADPSMRGLRDLFLHVNTLFAYKLTSKGKKAENEFAQALYTGARGNDLSVVIEAPEAGVYIVRTLMDGDEVDTQTVAEAGELQANKFLVWKPGAVLAATAGTPLTGGQTGEADADAHEAFLQAIEPYSFNTLGAVTTDETVKTLYTLFTKRMREEEGVKFQTVLYHKNADYPGVINVKNRVLDEGEDEASLVYWVTGMEAACAVNRSCQNARYDGEFQVDTAYSQSQLRDAILSGEFVLHMVGKEVRVLDDINSMVSLTADLGEVFRENQTMRVVDQIANDIAVLFRDKYLGLVPNDAAGRVSLWADIVHHHETLAQLRAIENFQDSDIEVLPGETKKSVVVHDIITVVNAMSKLYMTVTVA